MDLCQRIIKTRAVEQSVFLFRISEDSGSNLGQKLAIVIELSCSFPQFFLGKSGIVF
jgi:hypothetical protein